MSIQTIINGMGSIDSSHNTTGLQDDDIQHMLNMFTYQEGVLNSGNDDFKVTETSPASMAVEVKPGQAVVENDSYVYASHTTKYWYVKSDSTETVTISSNTSGNDRIDIIVLKRDNSASPDDTASNVFDIEVVEGTPAASPSAPATPSDSLKLAEVYVANGASSITNSNITDSRQNLKFNKNHINITSGTQAARAYKTSTQTIANVTWTAVTWDVEEFDTNGFIDLSSHNTRITIPEDGYYVVGGTIGFDANNTGLRLLTIRINGDSTDRHAYHTANAYGASAYGIVLSSSTILQLSSGDYVEMFVYQDSGGNLDTQHVSNGDGRSAFYIYKIQNLI